MNYWREYLDAAFRTIYYGGQHEKHLARFIHKWGEPDLDVLLLALTKGTTDEKAIALFTIGQSHALQARTILLPYLQNAEPMLRWASAISLGEMKEETALPVLVGLLDEFLPPYAHPLEREGGLYHSWRLKIVNLLGEWGRGELVPVLRSALEKSWKFEQLEQPVRKHIWHSYQDELLYSLGRSGAFGAIVDFALTSTRLHLWMVILSCGYLQSRTRYGDMLTQIQISPALQHEIAGVLERRFGLSKEEQRASINNFAEAFFERMSEEDLEEHSSALPL